MQRFDRLSWWERDSFLDNAEHVVIGAGITGSFCALRLRKLFPKARIVILERGFLPSGASTKNAGFACFGSPSELLDDIQNRSPIQTEETLDLRFRGLERLLDILGPETIGYEAPGTWELFSADLAPLYEECRNRIGDLNALVQKVTGKGNAFSLDEVKGEWGFQGFQGSIRCELEGMIDTGRMMKALGHRLAAHDITLLTGIEVSELEPMSDQVRIHTNLGTMTCPQVYVATNGLSRQLLPDLEVNPARAQVLITEPVEGLPFAGTFHVEQGFYYFRNVGDRILLGGGRNLDFEGETTTLMDTSERIMGSLERMLHEQILPGRSARVAMSWAGIMGVGPRKNPIIKSIHPRVAVGVRLGGMGVAMGSEIGTRLADELN